MCRRVWAEVLSMQVRCAICGYWYWERKSDGTLWTRIVRHGDPAQLHEHVPNGAPCKRNQAAAAKAS